MQQQTQMQQANRIQQTPTPPPQQQSAPLLAQIQTPTSTQVNCYYKYKFYN